MVQIQDWFVHDVLNISKTLLCFFEKLLDCSKLGICRFYEHPEFAQPNRAVINPSVTKRCNQKKGKKNQTFMKTYKSLTEHLLMENHAL